MKLGLVQMSMSSNIDLNLSKAQQMIAQCASEGAQIVCLPELFATQYFAQTRKKMNFELAQKIPGELTNFLLDTSKEHKVTLVGGSIFEEDNEKFYNTCLVVNPSGIKAKYRKMHIPNDPYYWEKFYFTPGNLGYVQSQTGDAKIAPLICWDQWFLEPARINALEGAQIIFYPTAIGWFKKMKQQEPFSKVRWEDAMRSHASLNGVYVVAVNRVGKEGHLDFWGNSFVADPFGQIVAKCSDLEDALVVDIDLDKVKQSQESWQFLKARRPDSYRRLTE